MSAFGVALLSVLIVSLLPLIALIGLFFEPKTVDWARIYLISLATGALFGDAFIHLLPETYRTLGPGLATALWCIGGVFAFFLLDQLVRNHFPERKTGKSAALASPMIAIALAGVTIHNFLDGLLIGASYLVSTAIGLSTTLAIVLHEIPHELGDVGVLLQGGLPLKRAIRINFFCGLIAILGTVTALVAGNAMAVVSAHLLPLGAGGFLYLAGTVLIPELLEEVRPREAVLHLLFLGAGVGAMAILVLMD